MGNVGVDLADNVVRRGDDVVVDLTGASSGDIEVGLIAVELVTDVSRGGGGNGTTRYSARQHRIHEQFVPYEDVPVRLAVPADGPIGYAGDGVSVHWIVRLRSKSTSAGAGGWPITVWGRQ